MKKILILGMLFLSACSVIELPKNFVYQTVKAKDYTLASWQKQTDDVSPVRIYLEGDGHAFNYAGQPTSDPTPKGDFLRKIAFNDPNPNVVYLARPCQYVMDESCTQKDWTTGRFSQKIIDSVSLAIQKIADNRPVILIGYSGGAMLTGLVIRQNPQIKVQKWMTLAGVLNHALWTQDLKLPPLSDSVDLDELPKVNQHHYVGAGDRTVSSDLTQKITQNQNLTIILGATHISGFDDYLNEIYQNK
jgi:hypothetical protein